MPIYAAYVDEAGKIIDAENGTHIKTAIGVRPAVYIDLSKLP